MTEFTTHLNLELVDFNQVTWHDQEHNNWRIVDALFGTVGFTSISGMWANSTAYTINDRVIDPVALTMWSCNVNHTSAAAPTLFSVDRANNPTYWTVVSAFGAIDYLPIVDDVTTLGELTHRFSDLFLKSAGTINFNNGNYIITHSPGLLTLSGALTVSGVSTIDGYISRASHHFEKTTTPLTAVKADHNQFWRFTATATLNLTAAATLGDGWCLFVRAEGLDTTVTIDPDGAELIEGLATLTLTRGQMVKIVCTGTAFYIEMTNDAIMVNGNWGVAGALWGFRMYNAADFTNDIGINQGACADIGYPPRMMFLGGAGLVKRLDAAWAVGDANGMLDQGALANGTYHIHAIMRPDTMNVDIIASLSHDEAFGVSITIASPAVVTWLGIDSLGHGLVAGSTVRFGINGAGVLPTGIVAGTVYYVIAAGLTATTFQISATNGGAAINTTGSISGDVYGQATPLMPTNYTSFRRIGSIIRTAGAILGFQHDGDRFVWKTPQQDHNVTNPGTAAVTRSLTTPYGLRVEAELQVHITTTTVTNFFAALISDLTGNDVAPGVAAHNAMMGTLGTAGTYRCSSYAKVKTSSNAQVRTRIGTSDAATVLGILTLGYVDERGRYR